MSVDIRAGGPTELAPPRVNTKLSDAKLEFGSTEAVLYGTSTAGKSASIRMPTGAMKLYGDLTGFLGGFASAPGWREPTGYFGVIHKTLGLQMDEPKAAAIITILAGTEGFMAFPVQVPPPIWPTNMTSLDVLTTAKEHVNQARTAARRDVRRQLDKEKATYAQRPPSEVISELIEGLGMSQLVMAQALNVSPTAIRKWRRGESARPEHRDALASLAAFTRVLEGHVHDPSGWMEIPISTHATLTPLDLFEAKILDLAVLFAAGLFDSDEVLGALAPDLRKRFEPDLDYDVVQLRDGSQSAVPRGEAHR